MEHNEEKSVPLIGGPIQEIDPRKKYVLPVWIRSGGGHCEYYAQLIQKQLPENVRVVVLPYGVQFAAND